MPRRVPVHPLRIENADRGCPGRPTTAAIFGCVSRRQAAGWWRLPFVIGALAAGAGPAGGLLAGAVGRGLVEDDLLVTEELEQREEAGHDDEGGVGVAHQRAEGRRALAAQSVDDDDRLLAVEALLDRAFGTDRHGRTAYKVRGAAAAVPAPIIFMKARRLCSL